MSLLFLICGFVAALATRNAVATVILSAVALPVAVVAALIGGGPVVATGLWLYLAFVLGAAVGFAGLVVLAFFGPQWARDLKGSLLRGTPRGKQGL